jgi:hypothetical protein
MKIKQDIQDLLEITQTLRKETRLRVLRNILKILLIGFFLGRDIDRKISETRSRRNLIVEHIHKYLDEVDDLPKRLEETKKVDAFTARVNERESLTILLAFGQAWALWFSDIINHTKVRSFRKKPLSRLPALKFLRTKQAGGACTV